MADKLIQVKGHWKTVPVKYEIRTDIDNPSNEVEIPVAWKEVWVEPYTKRVRVA